MLFFGRCTPTRKERRVIFDSHGSGTTLHPTDLPTPDSGLHRIGTKRCTLLWNYCSHKEVCFSTLFLGYREQTSKNKPLPASTNTSVCAAPRQGTFRVPQGPYEAIANLVANGLYGDLAQVGPRLATIILTRVNTAETSYKIQMASVLFLILAVVSLQLGFALDNGLARTPFLGWSSYNYFGNHPVCRGRS